MVRRGWAGWTLASEPSGPAKTRVAACAPGTPAERPLVPGTHAGEGHGPQLRSPGACSPLWPPGQTSLGLEGLVWGRRVLPGSRRPPHLLSVVGHTCAARPGTRRRGWGVTGRYRPHPGPASEAGRSTDVEGRRRERPRTGPRPGDSKTAEEGGVEGAPSPLTSRRPHWGRRGPSGSPAREN